MNEVQEHFDTHPLNQPTAESEPMTILSCMSDIVESSYEIHGIRRIFNKNIFKTCEQQIQYVCDMVGISPKQALLLSIIIENNGKHGFDKHDLADAMGLSFIKILSYNMNWNKKGNIR